MDIVVVSNVHRPALIAEFLKGLPHKISLTEDYELPDGFVPTTVGLVQPSCHVRHLRCFKGHQDAIKKADEGPVLVFEDDAVPNVSDWHSQVVAALPLLDKFEMVSFHGRGYVEKLYEEKVTGFLEIIEPKDRKWVVGALAYLVRLDAVKKILTWVYDGTPIDILLYNELTFCMMTNSIFNHDRSQGSLLD